MLSWPAAWAWGLAGPSDDGDDDDLGHSHYGTTHLRVPHTRFREEKLKIRQSSHLSPADCVAGVHLGLALPLLVSGQGRRQRGGGRAILALLAKGIQPPLLLLPPLVRLVLANLMETINEIFLIKRCL